MILRKLLMLVFLTVVVCVMSAGVGAAAVITVDDSGGADYTSIQAEVDAASTALMKGGVCHIKAEVAA